MRHDPDYEAMLERMIHGSPTISFECRNEPGQPTDFVSQNVQDILGRSTADFLGDPEVRNLIVHEEDILRVQKESEIAYADPSVLQFDQAPYRVKHANGSWIWVKSRMILTRDEEGEIVSITGFVTDVSDLLSLQRQILEETNAKDERRKKKECLSSVRDIVNRNDLIHEALDEVVATIPSGWQFPELTCARVIFDDIVHETTPESPSAWLLDGDLQIAGLRRGSLQVWYSVPPEDPAWASFMPEEDRLFNDLLRVISLGIERKEALKALKDYELVVSSAKDMLAVITRNGKIRLANTAFKNTFGLLNKYGLNVDVLPVLVNAGAPEDVKELFKGALAGASSQWQGPICGKNGVELFVSADLTPFVTTDEGIEGVLVAIRDITQEKSREAHLVRLTRAIEQASESIVITDAQSRIEYVNPFFEKITGYSFEEVKGQNPRVLKSGSVPESFYRGMWTRLASGRAWEGRFVNRTKDGRLITEEATISPVLDEAGVITNFIAVKRDITREVALSSRLESFSQLETITRMVKRAQHELTNDMTIILGHAELLMDIQASLPGGESSLATIIEMAKRAASLLDLPLAWTAEEPTEDQNIDLEATLEATVSNLRRMIPESIRFDLLASNTPFSVALPANDLDHIVTHMVLNGVDAIKDEGRISISTVPATWLPKAIMSKGMNAKEYVLMSISDDGCGMDDLVLSQVFDDMYSTKTEGLSTGMGLSNARRIIHRYDGYIDVESAEGKGTIFRIWLPLCLPEETVLDHDHVADSKANGRRILVVDDDPALLEMTHLMLELEGFDVATALSGADAISTFSHADPSFDLLLSDVMMDPMNGVELAEHWKTLFPDRPVILMSGYANLAELNTRFSSGGIDYLQKPFESETLLSFVFEALDKTKQSPLA